MNEAVWDLLLESSRFIVTQGVGDRVELDFPSGEPDHESPRSRRRTRWRKRVSSA